MKYRNMVGQEAGHLALTDKQGVQVHLSDFRGAWLWMIFHRHLG